MSPNDFGPIYAETDMTQFPVEPFNTVSNVIFLLMILYFTYQTRLRYQSHPLLVTILPILSLGFIGERFIMQQEVIVFGLF
ncbi:MAG: hypothetical protein H6619_06380 [Deltaproteobacteria bacterium]|nr:hypothetical protein [Deltaproteobacteria bacterium]